MMNKLIHISVFVLLSMLLVQCEPDEPKKKGNNDLSAVDNTKKVEEEVSPFTPSDLPLPDACSLLTAQDVEEVLGIAAGEIQVKDGSNPRSAHARSCFFKWVGERVNAGILVQVQKNPVGDEFPEWPSSYVSSKRTSGESDFSGSGGTIKYNKLEGLGDDGSYSYDLEKYVWRTANDYVYMIAFNEDMTEAKQKSAALQLGQKIMARVGK